jgi:hypothetical protein
MDNFFFNLGSIFFGLKIAVSCFGYFGCYSKGCLSATPSFSLLDLDGLHQPVNNSILLHSGLNPA